MRRRRCGKPGVRSAGRRIWWRRLVALTGALTRYAVLLVAASVLGAAVHPGPLRADSTGERAPTATSGDLDPVGAQKAFVCSETPTPLTATFSSSNLAQVYSGFGFNIPAEAVVSGIQVHLRALNDGTGRSRKLRASLSWNGGINYTPELQTTSLRNNFRDYYLGNSTYLWGRTAWTLSEVSNTNFRVKVVSRNVAGGSGSGVIQLDCIPVTVFYVIPGAPNLSIDKTVNPDPVLPGQNLAYTITYANTGASTATNVTVTDTVPTNTTFSSASPVGQVVSAPPVGGAGTVTWNVGSVAPGASGSVSMFVKVNNGLTSGTVITNGSYNIKSDQNPSPTAGNPVSATVQGSVVLTLSKSDSPDPVGPGATLVYTLAIANHSTSTTATSIVVSEAFDLNVTYTSYATSNCGPTTFDSVNVQWTIASIAPNLPAPCTLTITTTVSAGVSLGTLLVNTADLIDDAGNTASASAITTVGGCAGAPNGAACDDGNACTRNDTCQGGVCTPGTAVVCTALDQCHAAGICNPATGVCSNPTLADGSPCSDGNACTDNDACINGVCFSGGLTNCNDHNQCTDDSCSPVSGCLNTPVQDGIACGNADVCDGIETCQMGICSPGIPSSCNDGNDCTRDACDRTRGCLQIPTAGCCDSDADCADTSQCTRNEHCVNHACTSDPVSCDDGISCTNDSCNPSSGCVHTPVANNTSCDDGDVCNGISTCQNGVCQAGTPPNCDDGNACTSDHCNSQTGCTHQGTPACCSANADCADNTPCTVNERCEAGRCVSDPLECDDGLVCSADRCDPTVAGGCVHNPLPDGEGCGDIDVCNGVERCQSGSCVAGTRLNCDDGDACTDDLACDPALGCRYAPRPGCCTIDADCADQSECTIHERCENGSCTSDPRPCDDGNVCTADSCDPTVPGGCVYTPRLDGANCSDGDVCNGIETCQGGQCAPGTPLNCDDGNGCTIDLPCDPATGCHYNPKPGCCTADADCADSSLCTINERCTSNGSCTSDPQPCDDGNACTADSCDPARGCVNTPVTDGAACGDVDVCNGVEVCLNGHCSPGTPLNCDDGNACTTNLGCDRTAGCQYAPIAGCCTSNADCVDQSECTINERCENGACTSTPRACDDSNVCTQDSCDPTVPGGCVYAPVVDGEACGDADVCNGIEVCRGGHCIAGTPLNCDDGNVCTTDLPCDPMLGCRYDPVAGCCTADANCADLNACTINERCVNHACISDGLSCDDGTGCTHDSCSPQQGCLHTPLGSGSCDDGNPCTTSDACNGGVCSGVLMDCSDGNVCNEVEACIPATGQCSTPSGLPALCAPGSTHFAKTCGAEWDIINPSNPYGVAATKQYCRQGDPTCDFDNTAATCTFHVAVCFRVPDSRLLPSCSPSDVTQFSLLSPTAKKDQTSYDALMAAVRRLPGSTAGRKPRDVVFNPPLGTVMCTDQVPVAVPVGTSKKLGGKTVSKNGVKDADGIKLKCVAAQ